MLEHVRHDNGVETLRSPLLHARGVLHAFSTRIGGVSPPPFDTLNLGSLEKSTGDDDLDDNAHVAENYRRFREAIGAGRRVRVAAQQVHGREVWLPPPGALRPADAPEADALIGADPAQLLTVRTADCLPVLFADSEGRRVAAAHAGWRGLAAGVLPAAVTELCRAEGVEAAQLVAAIGPGISVDRYEVGVEVANAFHAAGLVESLRFEPGGAVRADLRAAAVLQLVEAGLRPERIDTTDLCTHRDEEMFFSYRRSGRRSGRLASVIAAAG